MTKSLPSNPSLKHLRLEAKNILKAHKAADVSCCGILRNLNQFKDKPDKEILKAEVGLQEVQFALAMEYGFESWTEMKRHLQGSAKARMLHITWWKPFADQLRAAGVGDTGIWRDPVNEGPAPAGLTYADWWYTRRKFWFESGVVPREPVKPDGLSEMDKTLARYVDFDEVVLWSDSCLFDQCMLMRNLDWFAERDLGNTRLSVVCGDECPIPAIEESSDRITEFLLGREEVSAAQFEQASAAWAAYRSPDPAAVEAFISSGGSALPYLADALTRHLQRFPSSRNGLCRYEQESLAAIKDGPVTLSLVQKRVMAMEERPFGDSEFVDGIRRMALCDRPLLSATGPDGESINMPGDVWTLSLTPLGEMVMAGEQDFIKLNGIDRWVGGVHLAGTEAQWRWDETEERLVKTGPGRPARIASAPDEGTEDIIQEFRTKGPGDGTTGTEWEGDQRRVMGRLLGMGSEGFNVACKMARTPHGRVKRAAAFFFGRSDSDGARDELLLLMRDESVAVRLDALRAYARLLHPAGPEGMLWGWTLAKKAASLPQGVGAMAGMLDDPNYRVRNEAVSALGAYRDLNDDGVDAAFEKALNDSKHKVQHSAARILDSTCPKCGEKLLLSRYLQE